MLTTSALSPSEIFVMRGKTMLQLVGRYMQMRDARVTNDGSPRKKRGKPLPSLNPYFLVYAYAKFDFQFLVCRQKLAEILLTSSTKFVFFLVTSYTMLFCFILSLSFPKLFAAMQ